MSYDPTDSIPDREECPRCHGMGYRTVTGEPNLAYPCGCRDAEPEPEKDIAMMEEHDIDLLLDIYDVLDNYSDVEDRDGAYGITQVPNAAMRVRQDLRDLLLRFGVDPDAP